MKKFALIGHPLGHSFSKKYFTKKFEDLGFTDHKYDLFDLESIQEFPGLWKDDELLGTNVTVPYKEEVLAFLTSLDTSVESVGAANVIKKQGDQLIGFNTDCPAFRESVENWLPKEKVSALVLGTGGASKAIRVALEQLEISYKLVSRNGSSGDTTYKELGEHPEMLAESKLIINTTPLGTYPSIETKPDLPYGSLTPDHFLYDLVYNPEVSAFLAEGKKVGGAIKNGLEMLVLQAEKSWVIWND